MQSRCLSRDPRSAPARGLRRRQSCHQLGYVILDKDKSQKVVFPFLLEVQDGRLRQATTDPVRHERRRWSTIQRAEGVECGLNCFHIVVAVPAPPSVANRFGDGYVSWFDPVDDYIRTSKIGLSNKCLHGLVPQRTYNRKPRPAWLSAFIQKENNGRRGLERSSAWPRQTSNRFSGS